MAAREPTNFPNSPCSSPLLEERRKKEEGSEKKTKGEFCFCRLNRIWETIDQTPSPSHSSRDLWIRGFAATSPGYSDPISRRRAVLHVVHGSTFSQRRERNHDTTNSRGRSPKIGWSQHAKLRGAGGTGTTSTPQAPRTTNKTALQASATRTDRRPPT